ncbi:putative mannosidase [Saccharomycopsis crataegensis]|uniref:alpha-1,2-Mannosidase n=1 Tax=Saccharomycopsis crataegensis TaxID=43959 RepID=A0AAV5QV10_9ASCO|nr:putative mannosidase [Saccharomycopsis crataegensis]
MSFIAFARVKIRTHKYLLIGSVLLVSLFYVLYENDHYLNPKVINDEISVPHAYSDNEEIEDSTTMDNVQVSSKYPTVGADFGKSRDESDYKISGEDPVSLPRSFHFPPDPQNIFTLPKIDYSKNNYDNIQSKVFEENGGLDDEVKLAKIREMFMKSWKTYKKYAKGYDEVLPLSHQGKNPFVGWAITLIDSLDTLHLMGLTDEWDWAVGQIVQINFRKSLREYIPTFETVIRAFGGLVSAYDLSEDPRLLDKAIECGDMLVGIFDTPNNMPLLYYRWAAKDTKNPKFASIHGSVAEFGTLLLEFTRLGQITGNDTYYHFVHKIVEEVDKFIKEEKFKHPDHILNGLLPTHLDISGCHAVVYPENGLSNDQKDVSKFLPSFANGQKVLCQLVGLKHSPHEKLTYTLGGLSDSYYEYLIKQYHLLNGAVGKYLDMFRYSTSKMTKYMFFKAKLPSILLAESNTVPHLKSDPDDVLFLSEFKTEKPGDKVISEKTWISHLSCFAGGMFGLSSRITGNDEELQIAKKLTNGCYKIYELMELMPEWMIVEHCPEGTTEDDPECQFDVRDKIKRIRMETEGLMESHLSSDYDLLNGIEFNGGYSNRYDNLAEQLPESEVNIGSDGISEEDRLYRDINVDDQNFDQYKLGRNGGKYDTSKIKKFPPKPKPKFQMRFPIVESNLAGEKLTRNKRGDIIWRVGDTFNVPLYANNMDPKFILRPELIESVFYMYRITGDLEWREKGWKMFMNTLKHVSIPEGAAALKDVSHLYLSNGAINKGNAKDSCESFWFAETLKYYYLLFSDKEVWSLDDWVLNTEAHPFRRAAGKK